MSPATATAGAGARPRFRPRRRVARPPRRPRAPPWLLALLAPAALGATSCTELLSRMGRDRGPAPASEPPPELAVRKFGRWTCGAELPWGRPAPVFGLLRRLGPGKAWKLEIDGDGLGQLQVVGRHGRARQGCWAELAPEEVAALQRSARGARLCDRPEERLTGGAQSAYDIDLRLPGLECARHLTAAALMRTGDGRRFADDLRWWLDRVSNGSFEKAEAYALSGRPPPARAAAPATRGRLHCAAERGTIYGTGDSWLLDYSFQKGLLWRRDLEISEGGALAIEFASFQTGAHRACTGRLTADELGALRAALDRARPCELPAVDARLREDRGYVSVRRGPAECHYRTVRQEELRGSADGRRFDDAVMAIVAAFAGPGGVDPFDPDGGFLFDGRATSGRRSLAGGPAPAAPPARAEAFTPPAPRKGFAAR